MQLPAAQSEARPIPEIKKLLRENIRLARGLRLLTPRH